MRDTSFHSLKTRRKLEEVGHISCSGEVVEWFLRSKRSERLGISPVMATSTHQVMFPIPIPCTIDIDAVGIMGTVSLRVTEVDSVGIVEVGAVDIAEADAVGVADVDSVCTGGTNTGNIERIDVTSIVKVGSVGVS